MDADNATPRARALVLTILADDVRSDENNCQSFSEKKKTSTNQIAH